jgi:hypothetical protein
MNKDRVPLSGNTPTSQGSTPTLETRPDGQKADHWVLPEEERQLGFVRPVRVKYLHEVCGTVTSMPQAIAETYARQPSYYGSTFCCGCRDYFPVGAAGQFLWDDGSGEKVGQ